MSGIYIPGLRVPGENDDELWIAVRSDGTVTYNADWGWIENKKKAIPVPVPPHGRLIDSVPSADVQPVRHGRWKPGDMPTYGGFKCSLCKKNTIVYKPPYCPNCGAKMDGGET